MCASCTYVRTLAAAWPRGCCPAIKQPDGFQGQRCYKEVDKDVRR